MEGEIPAYIKDRLALYEKFKAEYDAEIAKKPRESIVITLPDGNTMEGTSWETTPLDIAAKISNSLAKKVTAAKVDGVVVDLTRPFEKSCNLELVDFTNEDGHRVFWHSAAHLLGMVAEVYYQSKLCVGPPIEDGFYYEMATDKAVTQADYKVLEQMANKAIKEKIPFERCVLTKAQLLELFKDNKYKSQIVDSKVEDNTCSTVYRCGTLIDLCLGPHLPDLGRVKAFKIMKNSASYFLGDAKNDSLQRIYGVAFPDNKQMKEHIHFLEEAAKRDHRRIGLTQDLFFFHELSPGSCFFTPHGTKIYNKLVDMQKAEYRKRGFTEVVSPNIYNIKLWETSGHWANYEENMFSFEVEKDKYALKPMNCPGHCLMFAHRERSYRDLPIRLADFGVLHRNEYSGALTGLTRVRRFQQDDAHIFCRMDQLKTEMDSCLKFLKDTYALFDFTFSLKLSTRPDKYLGEIATWERAESILAEALDGFGYPWEINPGDGAFYGPKIDITISDALRRKHQCATIQLDFQLPERFNLKYHTDNAEVPFERPVIIHRAILGSVERFIAILTENFGGKWPFWLSPRQIIVIPISKVFTDYAQEVRDQLYNEGFEAEVDNSDVTLNKKIRNAEIGQWNFIFVVGAEEKNTQSVNVRIRDDPETKNKGQTRPLNDMITKLKELRDSKSLINKVTF